MADVQLPAPVRELAEYKANQDGVEWSKMSDQARADYMELARRKFHERS